MPRRKQGTGLLVDDAYVERACAELGLDAAAVIVEMDADRSTMKYAIRQDKRFKPSVDNKLAQIAARSA